MTTLLLPDGTSMALPEVLIPIPVQTTRYLCPYCRRGRSTRRATVLHMPKCWLNPDRRGCKTCALFQPGRWPDKPEGVPVSAQGRCAVGFNLRPGLVTNCSKWKLKVSAA